MAVNSIFSLIVLYLLERNISLSEATLVCFVLPPLVLDKAKQKKIQRTTKDTMRREKGKGNSAHVPPYQNKTNH